MTNSGERCTQALNPWGMSWRDVAAGLLLQGVPAPELDRWLGSGCPITPDWKVRLDRLAKGNAVAGRTTGYAPSAFPGWPPFSIPQYPVRPDRAACYMRPGDMDPSMYGRPGFFGSTMPSPPLGGLYGRVAGWSGAFPGDGIHIGGEWRRLVPRGNYRMARVAWGLDSVLSVLEGHFPVGASVAVDEPARTVLVLLESADAFRFAKPCPKPHRIGEWRIVYLEPR